MLSRIKGLMPYANAEMWCPLQYSPFDSPLYLFANI